MPSPNTSPTRPPDISRALAITGWMTANELRWLAERASSRQVVVEVGSYMGRSTLALADHCPGTVYAIDKWGDYRMRWKNSVVWGAFSSNLAAHISSGKVVPIRGKTPEAWRALDLALRGVPPDMIFIDGDHRYDAVASDVTEALRRLAAGGLLCGHDYGHPTLPDVKAAVDISLGPLAQVAVDTIFEMIQIPCSSEHTRP